MASSVRTLVVAALVLGGCKFAVERPGTTAGIVAGTMALTTCELAAEDHKNCFIAGGAVGVGLALVAGFALWLGTEDEPEPATPTPQPPVDWSQVPDTTPAEPTPPPPPPPPPVGPAPVTPAPVAPAPAATPGVQP